MPWCTQPEPTHTLLVFNQHHHTQEQKLLL